MLNFEYDEMTDVIIIEGVKYSGQLFRELGILPTGFAFEILERHDGIIVLHKLFSTGPGKWLH